MDPGALHTSRHTAQVFQRRHGVVGIGATGEREAQSAQRVADLERAGQREAHAIRFVENDEIEFLSVARDAHVLGARDINDRWRILKIA